MDQDANWYGGIGLSSGHIVLDGDLAPLTEKGAQQPLQTIAHLDNC